MENKRDANGRFTKKYLKPNACKDCSTDITRRALRCKSCTNKHYNKLGLRGMRGKTHSPAWIKMMKKKMTGNPHTAKRFMQSGYLAFSYKGKNVMQHHYVWCRESDWGFIPRGFVVHHINENKLDNRIENLACVPRDYHTYLHKKKAGEVA